MMISRVNFLVCWFSCATLATRPVFNANRSCAAVLLTGLLALLPGQVLAHAEHDKARYVAPDGRDIGRCDSVQQPCSTIGYAVRQASKGDKVLVAGGHYRITDEDQLFLLLSELVPVKGGFDKHYQSQNNDINQTVLSGVPEQFHTQLSRRGFKIVNDGFARFSEQLQQRLDDHNAVQQSQAATRCVNGKAGVFNCSNVDLVGHLALGSFSGRPAAASDIWGHTDLNSGIEYALIGLSNGTAVVSLANPEQPVEVGTIAGTLTNWRDIKVYQFYSETLQRWQAYAYVSSEGNDRIQIIDLNQLPQRISLVRADSAAIAAHNIYISGIDHTTNTALPGMQPLLHIIGRGSNGGAATSFSLANPTVLSPLWIQSTATRADYSHDVASMLVTDSRANTNCGTANCRVLFDFNEDNIRLWNITNVNSGSLLSSFSYDLASYVHSGWWTEDKQFLFVHDELDEINHGINTTVRVFGLDNLRQPQPAGSWTGPTKAIDHNGFVRGNRYYMSTYQRGLTVLDITDAANPQQAGFFDTFTASDGASFNGMWGTYPYLPSGLILGSDINSGLYILRDTSLNPAAGNVSFTAASQSVPPGAQASVVVQRPVGTGAVSVAYELIPGRATPDTDYEETSGRLSWAADDNSSKTILVTTLDDGQQRQRSLFIRLFDPKNGLALAAPSYQTLTFGEDTALPVNTAPQITAASSQQVTVDQTVTLTATVTDAENDPLTFAWVQQSGTTVTLQNANTNAVTFVAPGDADTLLFRLTVTDSKGAASSADFTVNVQAPSGPPPVETVTDSSGGSARPLMLLLVTMMLMLRSTTRRRR